MGDAKTYSVQDLEELQQKLKTYKETLSGLKSGDSIEDVLLMKEEFTNFKDKTTELETLIEIQKNKIDDYNKVIGNLSSQIESLHTKIEELTENIAQKDSEIDNNLTSQNPSNNGTTYDVNSRPARNVIPTYKQLQKLMTQSSYITDIQSNVPSAETVQHPKDMLTRRKSSFFNNSQQSSKPFNDLNQPTPVKRVSIKLSNSYHSPSPDNMSSADTAKEKNIDKIKKKPFNEDKEIEKINNEEKEDTNKEIAANEEQAKKTAFSSQKEELEINNVLSQKIEELLKSEELIQKIKDISIVNESPQEKAELGKQENEEIKVQPVSEQFIEKKAEQPLKTLEEKLEIPSKENEPAKHVEVLPISETLEQTKEEVPKTLENHDQHDSQPKEPLGFLNYFRRK